MPAWTPAAVHPAVGRYRPGHDRRGPAAAGRAARRAAAGRTIHAAWPTPTRASRSSRSRFTRGIAGDATLDPEGLNGTNRMRLFVFGSERRAGAAGRAARQPRQGGVRRGGAEPQRTRGGQSATSPSAPTSSSTCSSSRRRRAPVWVCSCWRRPSRRLRNSACGPSSRTSAPAASTSATASSRSPRPMGQTTRKSCRTCFIAGGASRCNPSASPVTYQGSAAYWMP
jgi:hypothetical protein